jgi:hypothetical protein
MRYLMIEVELTLCVSVSPTLFDVVLAVLLGCLGMWHRHFCLFLSAQTGRRSAGDGVAMSVSLWEKEAHANVGFIRKVADL